MPWWKKSDKTSISFTRNNNRQTKLSFSYTIEIKRVSSFEDVTDEKDVRFCENLERFDVTARHKQNVRLSGCKSITELPLHLFFPNNDGASVPILYSIEASLFCRLS